jgi:glycosyltransferase involved in cell wall biosynthesis
MVTGPQHGISRYVTRMAEGLALMGTKNPLPYEPVFLRAPGTDASVFSGFETVSESTKFLSAPEVGLVPLAAKRAGANAFHSPSFASFFGASFSAFRCPWIVTIHDLIHLSAPGFSRRAYFEHMLKPFAQGARVIVTVSEFSRREIHGWLGDVPIELAPNALDAALLGPPKDTRRTLTRLGLEPGRYYFCLSNPKPHKNVSTLLEAYARLPEPRLPLVLGGVTPDTRISGVRAPQNLSDDDCHVLWSNCAAFAFPSKAEGFGLPPVEAALAGAPLLLADIEPLREALSPLGPGRIEWIDPEDGEAWTRALAGAGRQPREGQPEDGRRRLLEAYSIGKLGQAMDRIYRRVLELAS